jgi:anion-transporting  ArsA/GET3 family ATPase
MHMPFQNEKQRIIFVTGKGGVGKSTVAAAIAENMARKGQKTLLVELGDQSYFRYIYRRPISYEATEIGPRFFVSLWNGEGCLREYVFYLIRVKKIVNLFFDNKVMRTFLRAAPALKELAILGKITSGIRGWGPPLNFENIVVDCFSSGHFLALLRAPRGMAELIAAGPMGEQSRAINEVLRRNDLSKYLIVSLPEELPVSETIELSRDLTSELGIQPKVICNRVYLSDMSAAELNAPVSENASENTKRFVNFLKITLQNQAQQESVLHREFSNLKELPLIFSAAGDEVIKGLSPFISPELL